MRSRVRLRVLIAAVFATLGTSSVVSAANVWDGGGADANWTTALNWDNDTTPTFAAGLGITFGGTANLSPLLTANTTIGTITFNNTAGAFDLTSNTGVTLTLNSNTGNNTNLITNNDADTQTISTNLILASNGGETNLLANSGDIILNGSVAFSRVARFNANANRKLIINGDLLPASATHGRFVISGDVTSTTVVNSTGGTWNNTGNAGAPGIVVTSGTLLLNGKLGTDANGAVGFGQTTATTNYQSALLFNSSSAVLTKPIYLRANNNATHRATIGTGADFTGTYNITQDVTLGILDGVSANNGTSTGRLFVTALNADGVANFQGKIANQSVLMTTTSTPAQAVMPSVTKEGPGTVILAGANTYTGNTSVTAGTLKLANSSALGFGGVANSNAVTTTTVSSGAVLDLNGQSGINEPIVLNGTGSGSGALINSSALPAVINGGVASLNLTTGDVGLAANGSVTLNGGGGTGATAAPSYGLTSSTYTISNGGSYTTIPSGVSMTGGGGTNAVLNASYGVNTITVTNGGSGYTDGAAVPVTFAGGNGSGATATANVVGGVIQSITVTNPGTGYTTIPTISVAGGTGLVTTRTAKLVSLSLTNTGQDYTAVPSLALTGGSGTAATITTNSSAFRLVGFKVTNPGTGYTSAPTVQVTDAGTSAGTSQLSSVNLATASSIGGTGDITLNAIVTGTGNLTKVGNNTLTLANANTYTGTTTVSAGKLVVNGDQSTATGGVTIASGATLGGSGVVGGTTSIDAGATLAPGNSIGTLTFANGLSLADGALFNFELAAPGTNDLVSLTALTLNNQEFSDFTFLPQSGFGLGSYVLFDATSITGTLGSSLTGTINFGGTDYAATLAIDSANSNVVLNVAAIPEPSTFVLAGIGLLGFAGWRWQRRVRT